MTKKLRTHCKWQNFIWVNRHKNDITGHKHGDLNRKKKNQINQQTAPIRQEEVILITADSTTTISVSHCIKLNEFAITLRINQGALSPRFTNIQQSSKHLPDMGSSTVRGVLCSDLPYPFSLASENNNKGVAFSYVDPSKSKITTASLIGFHQTGCKTGVRIKGKQTVMCYSCEAVLKHTATDPRDRDACALEWAGLS